MVDGIGEIEERAKGKRETTGVETEEARDRKFDRLADDCHAYRALISPKWFRRGEITKFAFMRRGPHPDTGVRRDVEGLSVALCDGRDVDTTIQTEVARFPKSCEAVGSLTVSNVRGATSEAPLDVEQDRENHANITGLPEMPADDDISPPAQDARDQAEFLGNKLAVLATVVWIRPGKPR